MNHPLSPRVTWIRKTIGIVALLGVAAPSAWAKSLADLASGAPSYLGKQLPETSYVEITTKKLAHAKVLWVNFDLLREMGVDVPKEGLTADFEQAIIDAFGYSVPRASDPPSAFSQNPQDSKVMYADRYGGDGMGVNFGSGRAASVGDVQIKGIGITPLVGGDQSFDHANGGASIEESIREAVWGEVNNQELPYGANRVLAIIDTGTETAWSDGGKEPRALIVRQDPLRPAHFVGAIYGQGALSASDPKRAKNAIGRLADDLPSDADAASFQQKFETGLKNYVDRVADQYAAAFARSLYHGATSVSNFEISGRFIDYGTETAQPGFAPIRILEANDPAGPTEEIQAVLIDEFRNGVSQSAVKSISKLIPNAATLRADFSARYADSLQREFLALTGTPPTLVNQMMKNTSASGENSASRLFAQMQKLTGQDESPINVDQRMPEKVSKYNLREILTKVAEDQSPTQTSLMSSLADSIPEASVRSDFVNAYLAYYRNLLKAASKRGLPTSNLALYIREASKIRNREQAELYRSEMRANDIQLINTYESSGDRNPIWNTINEDIAAGERTFRDVGPFQLVLKETRNLTEGYSLRNIYDAGTNQEVMLYRVKIQNGKGYFYGNEITAGDLKNASVRYSLDGWTTSKEAPATDRGDSVEFRIPVGPPDSSPVREIDLAMHSPDGQVWWKKDALNIHLRVTPEDLNNACVMSLQRSWWE